MPPRTRANRVAWWSALLAGGPGWIVFDVVKLLAGSFLAYGAAHLGVSAEAAVRPAQMYLMAFGEAIHSPMAALILTSVFVVLSQIKINITNAPPMPGPIAWSNFFSRLTHSHPGRVVWVVFNIAIALLLMELGAYETIQPHAGVVFGCRDRLDRRAGGRPGHQQAARPQPARHRVQARPSL